MPAKVLLKGHPNKKQILFFKARTKYIAYGGSRGGGKSWAVRRKASLLCLKYSNLKVLLLRRTFPELEANHILPLKLELNKLATYSVSKKQFSFPNGSVLKLGYCKNENDVDQYQGQEHDVIFFEEATLFSEGQLVIISTCLRNVRTDFSPRIYYTCNPGGIGHSYIKRLFIDKEYEGDENPDDYTFIPASVFDNEILMKNDPTYISLLNNLPEDLRRAHRDGDWDALSGQFFKEFKRETHVIEPFVIPDRWLKYVAIDYGLDCTAAYWIAADADGYCYVYKELWMKNLIISEAARHILELSKGEDIKYYYVPPDLMSKRQETGKSAITIFQENGIVAIITRSNRHAGWLATREMLKIRTKGINDGIAEGKPMLSIFNNCTKLIKHLPMIQRSDRDPNDISLEPHDLTHSVDALRYFCVTYLSKPEVEKQEIHGTYTYGELMFKGYSKVAIDRMANRGMIKLI
jgi:phage terminase large subunit